jgi:phospholipase/lecithinase/hemolysin
VAYASNFQSTYNDSTVWVVDTHTAFLTAINDPTEYGAANATCYDSHGTTYLWWNSYHPAEAIHKLVAERAVSMMQTGDLISFSLERFKM